MTRKMFINASEPEEVRVAILDSRKLVDFDIETRSVEKNKGNIYKGVVMAVEPGLNAAFVNYGADKQGFLTANDVHPKYAAQKPGRGNADRHAIGELLKPKQTVLVQIAKDEVGAKGAVLTTYLSLAGRYVVLMPDSDTQGISRKIEDEQTRVRIREATAKLNVPESMGVIIRTAGRDRTRVELNRDLRVLLRLWDSIQRQANRLRAPSLIFKEQDVIIRALRDYFAADIDEIIVDADEAFDRAQEYINLVMPNHRSVLSRYVERRPIFHHYRIEEQIAAIYTPKVTLPGGGSIVIEPTEALVSIDVNSGKQKSGNQEETATETNVEAAVEIGRQLKLRDLGGIIVVDFIDMATRKNQQRVERALKDTLASDKARVKIGRISRNGTLEITRQRLRSSLGASVFTPCHICAGTGHVLNPDSHAISVLRRLRDRASRGDLRLARVRVEPEVANLLRTRGWPAIQGIEKRYEITIDIAADHAFRAGQDDFTFETNPDATVVPHMEPDFGPAPRLDDDDEQIADDLLDDEELRALEALDREDAARQLAIEQLEPPVKKVGRAAATDAARGKGRRVERERTPQREPRPSRATVTATTSPDDESLAMPTYEWVDVKSLRLKRRPSREQEGERPQPRDRRRRGERSRRPTSAQPEPAAREQSAVSAPKKSFWRRLLRL